MNKFLFLLPYLLSLGVTTSIFFYAWQHRHVRGANIYIWQVAGQAFWGVGYIFELISPELDGKVFWDQFQWIAAIIILITFPIFIFQFTETKVQYPRGLIGFSFVVPLIFLGVLFTDNQHHLLYPNPYLEYTYIFSDLKYDFTWVVYAYSAYTYLVMFFGLGILIRRIVRPHHLYRRQILSVTFGYFIPMAIMILTLAGVKFKPFRDISPFAFALGNLIIAWGLFRYKLFSIIPVARDLIVDNMNDVVVVLDTQDRVVDINHIALETINKTSAQTIGQPADIVFADWPELIRKFENPTTSKTKLAVVALEKQLHYEIKSTILYDKQKHYIGRVFVARNVTEHIDLQKKLETLNKELEERVAKRTEELRESAKQYRAVVESQTELITRWKPDRTRTFVNDAYCRYFGLTPEQAMATDFMALIVAEDRPAVEEKISRLISGETNVEIFTERVIKPDGSTGWLEWTEQVIRDESGEVIEVQSIGRDITERVQAEETILEQLAFNELMTNVLTRFAICSGDEIDDAIQAGLQEIAEFIGGDHAYVAIIAYDRNTWGIIYEWHASHVSQIQSTITELSLGTRPWSESKLLAGETIKINKLSDYPPEALAEKEYRKKEGALSIILIPISGPAGVVTGIIGLDSHARQINWSDIDVIRLKMVGDIIANVLERKRAEENLIETYDTTLEGWAKALEMRDKETKDHSQRVVELTVTLANAMGIEGDELHHIRRGAILHDIGKMGIPDEILRKRGKLTISERKVIEQHPVYSYELLSRIPFLEKALDIPYCHHESWDGSGYPHGLKGEKIPLAARIFSVIDVWDAVRSDRPYNKAWSNEKAIQYLKEESGKYFDPEIVDTFLNLVEQGTIKPHNA